MRVIRLVTPALALILAFSSPGRAGIPSYRRYASASRQLMSARNNNGNPSMMTGRNQGQQMARRGQQQVAQELRGTRALLAHADHDYQGHRALAIAQIDVALRALGHGGNGNGQLRNTGAGGMGMGMGNGNGNGQVRANGVGNAGAGRRMREPQAASDAQVRRAYQNLNQIQSQLGSLSLPGSQAARAAVMKAGGQLQLALKVR